jgi:hypothetical protein
MSNIIGRKLNETFENKQEASFIALRQLNHFNYLSEFGKQTNYLFDLLHFNSTIFS